jgi:glyoxylase-like metal-dependent hydrolase (beta-lactamase superfamily II)
MAVHVEPQPLTAPLSGGSPGASVSVEPLIAGHVDFPRAAMVDQGGSFKTLRLARAISSPKAAETVPVPAFLIRHPSVGPVLVDTGLHPSIASGGSENFGGLANRFGRPSLKAGEDVPSQLRAKGIEPRQVPVVVMTHLHLDHSSAISEFPDSTFVVSAAEWEDAAHGSKPSLKGYRRAHFDLAFEYRTVDFDGDPVGSYATFGRTFDLFGDGSVRLAFTPGHSAGHCSVICRLADADFVIGGDAM